MQRADAYPLVAVIVIAGALYAWKATEPTPATPLSFLSTISYHPIVYEEGDILDYEYHAFLRFQHPVIEDSTQFLNVRITNADEGIVQWLVKNLPMSPGH